MSTPIAPPQFHVLTDSEGVDHAEHWSQSFEGAEYGVELSFIHLSTERVDVGPPLHTHPYAEVVRVRRGHARFTVGTEERVGSGGQTFVIPAGMPHTFRTLGGGRYESLALHLSPVFTTELLEPDTMFR